MGKSGIRPSGHRAKKKRPPLNRYMARAKERNETTTASCSTPSVESTQPERPPSASKRKISPSPSEVEPPRADWSGYKVIDLDLFLKEILAISCCKICHSSLSIQEQTSCSLSSKFVASCDKCGALKTFDNSEFISREGKPISEINRRFVYAMRCIGAGQKDLEKFSALMDFPTAVTRPTYDKSIKSISNAVQKVSEDSMLKATEEEEAATGSNELSVSGDGSWQRRGHTSKNGIVSLIGVLTGKVLDLEVMSTTCRGCSSYKGPRQGEEFEEWWEGHQATCDVNHEGSAGSMESAGILSMFRRSEYRAKVKYMKYVGDGDSSTYPNLVKDQPYGPNAIPAKIECTGHVQKRMGTRLRKLKKDYAKKKLKDGKGFGGRGRLTDKKIDMIASYYGNAIRNSKTVIEMENAIWAIFFHYRSTDQRPQHDKCPKGPETWCKFNRAVTDGTVKKFIHKSAIPEAIMDAIKPVFVDLSKHELLQKCVGGHTQNPNESLNAVIWKNVPKTVFCTRTTVEIGARGAVLTFNDGQRSHIRVYSEMGIVSGPKLVEWVKREDASRISSAEKRALSSTKEARKAKRRLLKDQEEWQAEEEGPAYATGAF